MRPSVVRAWRVATWVPVAVLVNNLVIGLERCDESSIADVGAVQKGDIVLVQRRAAAKAKQYDPVVYWSSRSGKATAACLRSDDSDGLAVYSHAGGTRAVPKGHVLVGAPITPSVEDARDELVTKALIRGLVQAVVWPPQRWGAVHVPPPPPEPQVDAWQLLESIFGAGSAAEYADLASETAPVAAPPAAPLPDANAVAAAPTAPVFASIETDGAAVVVVQPSVEPAQAAIPAGSGSGAPAMR